MYKKPVKFIIIFSVCVLIHFSCKNKDAAQDDNAAIETRTPVTVTTVSYVPLSEYIELNATSSFLQKSFIKSNLNGYVKQVNTRLGGYVNKGQLLFVLKTKEAEAIGNSVTRLNPSFNFSGVNNIVANAHGFISELNHQSGDYVQDGEQLAVISNSKSFVFIMNVPYEDKPYVAIGKSVEVLLPDKERLQGNIFTAMPMIDSISQTQSFSVKINYAGNIPQNLVAIVRIVKTAKPSAATLPKTSVLSNETMSEFWVMKLINDTTAIKVPIKKGLEAGDKVEITSPDFSANDKILSGGNYGLADTALVIVQNKQQ